MKCYYRFDEAYNETPPDQGKGSNNSGNTTYVATLESLNDPGWYANSGASCHVTDNASNIGQKA